MAIKSAFKGKFYYYENVNGKEKKVEKSFDDAKKYDAFVKKYPMPSLWSFFGLLPTPSTALPSKKSSKMVCKTKKAPAKKKPVAKKKK